MQEKRDSILRKLNIIIVGDEKAFQFEHRFINSLSIGISATSFIGFLINLMLSLGITETVLTLFNSLIYFAVYCLSRFYNKVVLSKWIAILTAYLVLSVLWLNSAGSTGPIPYTYFLLVLSIVLITDGWPRIVLLLLLAIVVPGMFYLENRFPEWLVPYTSAYARRIDMVTSILLYFALGAIIMSYAKKNYIKEKLNAEKADKLKSAFLANMSHEIRTPMNAIMGFTSLLRKNDLTEEKKQHYHKTVEESVEYLLRLIDDILDISLIEADELSVLPKKFDLDEFMKILETSHKQLLPQFKKVTLELTYVNPGYSLVLNTDNTRLEQIFSNLISNAIKFTDKGFVKFGYTIEKNAVLFFVRDSGIGIDEKDQESVFERFVKLETSSYEITHRGTGIGLSIAKKVVELLEGRIWLESTPMAGTTFYFTLPLSIASRIREIKS